MRIKKCEGSLFNRLLFLCKGGDELDKKEVAKRASRRFGSHNVLYSKYKPQVPAAAEREYIRLVAGYMNIVKVELLAQLPMLKAIYKVNRDIEVREDSATDLELSVNQMFQIMKNNTIANTTKFGLRRKLELMANMNRKLTVKEWKKAVKATLGIDIREDYYLGDFYKEQMGIWVNKNVDLIKTIPEDTLDSMREIVYEGFSQGKTSTLMAKEIQKVYSNGLEHAKFIARDQTAKLNGKIQQAQQEDAGIKEYIWDTSGDSRTRKSHRELDGKKFSWSDPPLNSDGRRCHPGEDYACRCIGRPVFNLDLNLPLEDDSVTIR